MALKATEKSALLPTCMTEISAAVPSRTAPFGALLIVAALVTPFGFTKNKVFALAAAPSIIACIKDSRLIKSPLYSST